MAVAEAWIEHDLPAADPASWPAEELEAVPACPLCDSSKRTVVHDRLRDRVFGCAPGEWTLKACGDCAAVYLDPRPAAASLHKAYTAYYTHGAATDEAAPGLMSRLFRRAANGYRTYWLGLERSPRSRFGGAVLALLPWIPHFLRAETRHLGRPEAGRDRLLDVGCGSGAFLLRAAELGWRAKGIDVDPNATGFARSQGCDAVTGELAELINTSERFDVVTSSHVIEHVADPRRHLSECRELLEPGGILWLETPNSASYGHCRFGADWRDLDVPRHLVLFDRDNLRATLEAAGFRDVNFVSRGGATFNTFPVSRALAAGSHRAIDARARGIWGRLGDALIDFGCLYASPRRSEFLTVTARRAN